MPKQIIEDNFWKDHFRASERYYQKWEQLFKCSILEKYYEGFQWRAQKDIGYRPYVFNEIYETIQIKIAQFVPQVLKYDITASLGTADYDIAAAAESAKLKEDVLNTITQNQKQHYHAELEQAFKDHFFRFGIIEVGYEADWIINPRAPRPLLTTDINKNADRQKPRTKFEPPELPINERVFFKHVPAKRFRIGGMDHRYLEQCTWCGYYEWVEREDLLALPKLMNKDKIVLSGGSIPESSVFSKNDKDYKEGQAVKIWHIWHNKAGVRLIILDSPCVTIYQKNFKRLNIIDYRPDVRVSDEGFYPIPPVWHWLSPQDEINETREQLRKHRRRFIRKFQVMAGMVDDEEIEKFESGEDGALIKVAQAQAISAIDNPDLGSALDKAIVTSSDDLNKLSRTSSEVRGEADRTTATQAQLINQNAQLGESSDRNRISEFYDRIGREALLLIRDNFTIGTWAKFRQNPGELLFQTVQRQADTFRWVSTQELNDGYDFTIHIDELTLGPGVAQQEQQNFLLFLGIVNQYPQIAMSPILIREAAYRCNYRNEKVIGEFQKMALLHQFSVQQQMQQGQPGGSGQPQPGGGNQLAQGILAQKTPPGIEKTRQQISNQLMARR